MHQFIMGGGGTSGAAQSVRVNYTSFEELIVTIDEIMHQLIVCIL